MLSVMVSICKHFTNYSLAPHFLFCKSLLIQGVVFSGDHGASSSLVLLILFSVAALMTDVVSDLTAVSFFCFFFCSRYRLFCFVSSRQLGIPSVSEQCVLCEAWLSAADAMLFTSQQTDTSSALSVGSNTRSLSYGQVRSQLLLFLLTFTQGCGQEYKTKPMSLYNVDSTFVIYWIIHSSQLFAEDDIPEQ